MAAEGENRSSHTEASGRWTIRMGKGKHSIFDSNGQVPECEIGSDAPKIEKNKVYCFLF